MKAPGRLNLRAGPGITYAIITSYPANTVVRVLGKHPAEKWLQVRTPDGRVGWMVAHCLRLRGSLAHVPIAEPPVALPPAGAVGSGVAAAPGNNVAAPVVNPPVAQLPVRKAAPPSNGNLSAPAAVPSSPGDVSAPAAPLPAPTPIANGTVEVVPGATVEELPANAGVGAAPRALVAAPLALRVCYDRNLNKACDVDEGIGGLTVYVTDQQSGQLLGQALTDTSGQAQTVVRAASDAQLVVSVPYFGASQTVSANAPRLQPVIVNAIAPVPALLP